jgi:hypothetical protein
MWPSLASLHKEESSYKVEKMDIVKALQLRRELPGGLIKDNALHN